MNSLENVTDEKIVGRHKKVVKLLNIINHGRQNVKLGRKISMEKDIHKVRNCGVKKHAERYQGSYRCFGSESVWILIKFATGICIPLRSLMLVIHFFFLIYISRLFFLI
jgi:hypothetical protein